MRKGLQKIAAFLLAVCMVFSLFVGMPVSVKAEGESTLVVAWASKWDASNPEKPIGHAELSSGDEEFELNSKLNHVLYFGMSVASEEGDTTITDWEEELVIKNSDGTADVDENVGTVNKYTIDDVHVPGYYDVKFGETASGTYRIYAGNSYITVKIVDPDAGFYNSSTINTSSYIDDQEWDFSEKGNRTLYFAMKQDSCTIINQEGKQFHSYGNMDEVSFQELESTSNGYVVYQITLGDKFEEPWLDRDYFQINVHVGGDKEWAFDSEFVVELNLDPVGLVYCYPAWNYAGNCYDYEKPSGEYWKVASQTNLKEVLYFGYRTAEGMVTPITDASKIAIDGGAILEKYEGGSDGFYTLTLPERDKEYTFTYENSSIRIFRDTPIIQFSSDASCQNELFETVTVEDGNTAFYVRIEPLEEENTYKYIVGMDEENESDTEGYYFRKDYTTDSVLQISGSAPITVTQVNAAEDGASSAKIYKIEVKNTAPDEFSLRIKAKINEWWTEDVTIQIENKISGSTTTGGGTSGGGATSGGSTSDSNTTTETKPDGSTVETTTETKSDGTKVETTTETKTDGTKIETSTETKTDGSKVESSTETKSDGSKTETVVETAADGSVKTTETVTQADGSATKTEKENETNTKGKDVAVTTTTKTDSTGAVTSVTEKSVIANSSATTSTTVTVKKGWRGSDYFSYSQCCQDSKQWKQGNSVCRNCITDC